MTNRKFVKSCAGALLAGALTGWAAAGECGCNPDCPADFDGNGVVDGADLGELLARWGPAVDNCADLDCNDLIDGADLGSLLAQWGPCPKVALCPKAANDCCTTGGPGCSDVECCETVCAADPFCCDTAWDSICVDEAIELCGLKCPSVCREADHDCSTTGGPGCTDIECCETVCAVDPFCCQTAWDSICVDEVFVFCVKCDVECPDGSTDEGEPCGENTNGGCNTSPQGPFGEIACGETICGTGWAEGGTRDTDWFQISVNQSIDIVLTCEAEFPVLFGVIDTGGVPDCALAGFVDPFAIANPCTETDLPATLTPGTWWIFVAPATFDGFPCDGNNQYWLTLNCAGGAVKIDGVFPPEGNAGAEIQIQGAFPSQDPFDYCVHLIEPGQGQDAEGAPVVIMAPIQVVDIAQGPGGQVMFARIGPVPDNFEGEVVLNVIPGTGGPTELINFFPDLCNLNDAGACWGDPQPGGANIIFNITPRAGGTACGPGWDRSYVGGLMGGSLCVTLAPGPLPGGAYPAGTKFAIWPRFHTCNGQYVSDFGTIEFMLVANATVAQVAGLIEFFVNQEVVNCGAQNGLIPDTDANPVGALDGPWQICMEIPGRAFCAGNLVICVDLP